MGVGLRFCRHGAGFDEEMPVTSPAFVGFENSSELVLCEYVGSVSGSLGFEELPELVLAEMLAASIAFFKLCGIN